MSEPRTQVADPRRIEVIDEATAAMFRAMSSSRRVELTARANLAGRALVEAGLRQYHPEWSDNHIHLEIARRMANGST